MSPVPAPAAASGSPPPARACAAAALAAAVLAPVPPLPASGLLAPATAAPPAACTMGLLPPGLPRPVSPGLHMVAACGRPAARGSPSAGWHAARLAPAPTRVREALTGVPAGTMGLLDPVGAGSGGSRLPAAPAGAASWALGTSGLSHGPAGSPLTVSGAAAAAPPTPSSPAARLPCSASPPSLPVAGAAALVPGLWPGDHWYGQGAALRGGLASRCRCSGGHAPESTVPCVPAAKLAPPGPPPAAPTRSARRSTASMESVLARRMRSPRPWFRFTARSTGAARAGCAAGSPAVLARFAAPPLPRSGDGAAPGPAVGLPLLPRLRRAGSGRGDATPGAWLTSPTSSSRQRTAAASSAHAASRAAAPAAFRLGPAPCAHGLAAASVPASWPTRQTAGSPGLHGQPRLNLAWDEI